MQSLSALTMKWGSPTSVLDIFADAFRPKKNWEAEVKILKLQGSRSQTNTSTSKPKEQGTQHIGNIEEQETGYSDRARIISSEMIGRLFPKSVERLHGLKRLNQNWNDDNALSPSRETLLHAFHVLYSLIQEAIIYRVPPPEPRITCGAKGDILFAWTFKNKEIELDFSVDHGTPFYEYLVCSGPEESFCDEGSFEGELTDSVVFKTLMSCSL